MDVHDLQFDRISRGWMERHWDELDRLCTPPEMRWSRDNYLMDLPAKWEISRVAVRDGARVGYCLNSRKGAYLWLHRLVVRDELRSQGAGRSILAECRRIVEATPGLKGIILKAAKANEGALRFYHREGFERMPDLGDHAVFRWDSTSTFTVGIHQPNYLPWLGYFYKMYLSDGFVLLDDVPAPKGSYTTRCKVWMNGEGQWLTVPSSRSLHDEIWHSYPKAEQDWVGKHLRTLQASYGKSPYFGEFFPELSSLIQSHRSADFAELNAALIGRIAGWLGLAPVMYRSSQFGIEGTGDERLAEIVQLLRGHVYMSGAGGANYQSEETFAAAGIELRYSGFTPQPYPQRRGPFVPGLSVLDALFNIGPEKIVAMFEKAASNGGHQKSAPAT